MSELASLASTVFGILLYLFLISAFILLFLYIRLSWTKRRKRKKILVLLQDQHLDSFLENSPYKIGHAQGESGYRITDSRKEHEIVQFAATEMDAQLWIAEQSSKLN
jgi:hypothetical protein